MPVRASIVILILISAFTLAGRPLEGVPVTIGALFAAFADVGEHLGHRWRTMLWTTAWLMAAGFVAELVSESSIQIVAMSVVVAALAGLACGIGPRAALIGTVSLVTFTVFAGIPELPSELIPNAALIGLGGIVQTAVTCVPPLLRNPSLVHKPEDRGPVFPRLRTCLHPSDPFVRHALRLALAIGVATAIAQSWHTAHSYWIPMTVAWISKPDVHGTIDKVAGRIVGTLLGLAVVGIAFDVLHLGHVAMILSVAVGCLVTLAFVWANYAVAVMGVTILVGALLAPAFAEALGPTIGLRFLDTLIAAVITVLVSFLWMTPSPAPATPPAAAEG